MRVAVDSVVPGVGPVVEAVSDSFWDQWGPSVLAGAAAAGGSLLSYFRGDVSEPDLPFFPEYHFSPAIVGGVRVNAPSLSEQEQLQAESVPGDRLCGGKICDDFIFDMAIEREEEKERERRDEAISLSVASDLSVFSSFAAVYAAVKKAFGQEDETPEPTRVRQIAKRVKGLLESYGGVTTVRPVRDYFGPSTARYRRAGYMRRSGAGYPYLA